MAPSHVRTADSNRTESITIAVVRETFQALRDRGYDVSDVETLMRPPEYSELPSDVYVLPEFATDGSDVSYDIRQGKDAFNFALRETEDGEAKTQDESHFTAVAVSEGKSIDEIVDTLHRTGQIEAAIDQMREDAPVASEATDIVAYAIATYLKGVAAEKLLTSLDRFSKAGVSNDQHGDDVYDAIVEDNKTHRLRQVKCVTARETEHSDVLYYQFTADGGIVFGDDYKDVAEKALQIDGREDLPKTLTYRTHSAYRYETRRSFTHEGGTVRFAAWE